MRKDTVKFGKKTWIVLKETPEKLLLAGSAWAEDREMFLKKYNYLTQAFDWLKYNDTSEGFFDEARRFMKFFYDYCFSEEDRKHILTVENKYPVKRGDTFIMENRKDRVFPLKYEDVCDLTSDELCRFYYSDCDNHNVGILLPSVIDEYQRIPTINLWNYSNWVSEWYYYCVNCQYESVRYYLTQWIYDDFYCIPSVWVDSGVKLIY